LACLSIASAGNAFAQTAQTTPVPSTSADMSPPPAVPADDDDDDDFWSMFAVGQPTQPRDHNDKDHDKDHSKGGHR
jgi:hypothetical protein